MEHRADDKPSLQSYIMARSCQRFLSCNVHYQRVQNNELNGRKSHWMLFIIEIKIKYSIFVLMFDSVSIILTRPLFCPFDVHFLDSLWLILNGWIFISLLYQKCAINLWTDASMYIALITLTHLVVWDHNGWVNSRRVEQADNIASWLISYVDKNNLK